MKIFITEQQLNLLIKQESLTESNNDIESSIKYLHNIPSEYKEFALKHLNSYTNAKNGVITGLKLHSELIKKIKEKNLPDGFYMGVDKNGYFIMTHRARSKSHENPSDITIKEINFIDSTG